MTPAQPRAATSLRGQVAVPGDKSISHRALMLSALAPGTSRVVGMNRGRDVAATAAAIRLLGGGIETKGEGEVEVKGWGSAGPVEPGDVIDAGNSGTTLRCVLGLCARVPGLSVLTGDASLRRRPMSRVAHPLRSMGAAVDGRNGGEFPPLAVRGGPLTGIEFASPVASAQVKSALLLAGLGADGVTAVVEPAPSRDHTERMLEAAGVPVSRTDLRVAVRGGAAVGAREWRIPGDLSAAMFLFVAAALVPGSRITVVDVGLNPTRTAALDVLAAMGAGVEIDVRGSWGGEPVGSVTVTHGPLTGVEIPPDRVPALIDEIPALAVAAAFADGATTISGASELRVKESDRIAALVEGLDRLGADVQETSDGLRVTGPRAARAAEIESHDDHRIALAFATAGLATDTDIRIRGWRCVETSYPGFLDVMREATGR